MPAGKTTTSAKLPFRKATNIALDVELLAQARVPEILMARVDVSANRSGAEQLWHALADMICRLNTRVVAWLKHMGPLPGMECLAL